MKKVLIIFLSTIMCNFSIAQIITTYAGSSYGFSGDGGSATLAELNQPEGVAVDGSGNVYIADYYNQRIRKVTPSGIISTFAGNGSYTYGGDGGVATLAGLKDPQGVAVDNSGNIYIADQINNRIRKVNTSGIITTVAGNGGYGDSGDGGAATAAELSNPQAVAVDNVGNIFIADYGSRIRKVSSSGIITTFAGNGGCAYSGDGGLATAAQICTPSGIAVDNTGNVYFSDYDNSVVRKVNTSGIISTFAGNGTPAFSGDGGLATDAELDNPFGVAVDNLGNVYIGDYHNLRGRVVNTSGIISTFAGGGTGGLGDGGAATAAKLNSATGIAVDNLGNIFIADNGNMRIRKISPGSPTTTLPSITGTTTVCVGGTTSLTDATSGGTWSSNNTSVATIVYSTGVLTGVTAGTATISYTASGGSITVIATVNPCDAGVENIVNAATAFITIFPNPNKGLFTVNISTAGNEDAKIIITNILGEKVKEQTMPTNKKTDVQLQIPAGIYFISAVTKDEIVTNKIVIE